MSKDDNRKWFLLGIGLMILSVALRLLGLGWLGMIGIGSVLFFLPIQIYYLSLDKVIEQATRGEKSLLISPTFLFPMIFLLQPDFGDSGGILIMFELLIGNEKRLFIENTSSILAIFVAISYLVIIIYLALNLKKMKEVNREIG